MRKRHSGDEPSLGGQSPRSDDVRLGGDAALVHIIANLNHANLKVRRRAALALAEYGDIRAFDALTELLTSGDTRQTIQVLKALGKLKDERGTTILIQYMNDVSRPPEIRAAAIRVLGDSGDQRLIFAIREVLFAYPYPFNRHYRIVSKAAVDALKALGDALLYNELLTRAERARKTPTSLLVYHEGKRLIPLLTERLDQLLNKTPIQFNKAIWMVWAFEELDDRSAVPQLLKLLGLALEADEIYRTQKIGCLGFFINFVLRRGVRYPYPLLPELVQALATLHDPRSIDLLSVLAKHVNHKQRRAAINALGNIRDPRVAQTLIEVLNDPEPYIRVGAIISLSRVYGVSESIPAALIRMLNDGNVEVTVRACEVLGQHRESQAVNGLIQCLTHINPSVRQSAESGLRRIGTSQSLAAIEAARRTHD